MNAKRTLQIIVGLAGAILVVPAVLMAFPALAGAERAEVVLTGSMEPGIHPGDLVFLEAFTYRVDRAEVGDVVAFQLRRNEIPVLHRVIDVIEGGSMRHYITQGDANRDPDPHPVPESTILGFYKFKIPYYGHLVLFAKSKPGMLLLVVLPSLVILVHESWKLVRYAREEDAETPAGPQAPPRGPIEFTEVRR